MERIKNLTQEQWFLQWCNDLMQAGYIKKVTFPDKGLEIYPKVKASYTETKILYKGTKRERTKTIIKYKTIFESVTYKPDAIITWADKSLNIFFTVYGAETVESIPMKNTYFYAQISKKGDYISPAEVKAPPGYGSKNSSDASFRILQKVLYHKFKIIVNKVYNYPNAFIKNKDKTFKRFKNPEPYLWASTFTPQRYLFTDKTLEPRKISNWQVRTLKEYINGLLP